MKPGIIVLGSGGHAKVVVSILQAQGHTLISLYDDDASKWGSQVLGAPVVGPLSEAAECGNRLGILAIGDNLLRKELALQFQFEWTSAIHPGAVIHPSVRLGAGIVVCAGAVLQPDGFVGGHAIVNTAATIDHDCVLGDYIHIAPGVHLAGGVHLGEGAFLGIGSSVIPGRRVGAWTTIGAGSVVVHDLPKSVIAYGVPARIQRSAARDLPESVHESSRLIC